MLRKFMFITIFLQFQILGWSQNKTVSELQPAGIGEIVPDIMLDSVHNFRSDKVFLHELLNKGSLIIFFWNLRCSPCVDAFAEIIKMGGSIRKNLTWLLVSEETDSSITRFFRKQELLTGIKIGLPYVCNNSALQQLFLPQRSPYCVWIDHQRMVRYVTNAKPLTTTNLSAFVNNHEFTLPDRKEPEIPFDPLKPLFINGYAGNGENLMQYTALSGYIKNMPWISGIAIDSVRSVALIFNFPVKGMYQCAYNDLPDNSCKIPDNRTIMAMDDTARYVYTFNNQLQLSNLWCYQRIVPKMKVDSLRKIVQKDLDGYFGLTASMEKQKRLCWVLTADDTTLLMSAGGKKADRYDLEHFSYIFNNQPMGALTIRFVYDILSSSPYPFIDETKYKGKMDLVLDQIVNDKIDSVQKALAIHKMHLQLEERMVDILVIKKANQ